MNPAKRILIVGGLGMQVKELVRQLLYTSGIGPWTDSPLDFWRTKAIIENYLKAFHPGLSRVMFVSQYLDARDESFDVRPLLENIPLKITRMEDFIRAG